MLATRRCALGQRVLRSSKSRLPTPGAPATGELLPFGHRPSRPVPYNSSQYKAILYFEITCLPLKITSRKGELLRAVLKRRLFQKKCTQSHLVTPPYENEKLAEVVKTRSAQ